MPTKPSKPKKTLPKSTIKSALKNIPSACAQQHGDRRTPCLACLDLINIAVGVAGILDNPRPQR